MSEKNCPGEPDWPYYLEGRRAYYAERKLGECPFPALAVEWQAWRDGWLDANDFQRKTGEQLPF